MQCACAILSTVGSSALQSFSTLSHIINDETFEQVSQFTFLDCNISYKFSNCVEFKLANFLQLIGNTKRTTFKKVRMETILKIYSTLVFPTFFICVRKFYSNSLTKTKNWSGRNEVTETSGRLHPIWPQNRWLHTPRTTDYRHTRQDRWIQTELAFTLAKNATKQNPFGIIPLRTTRKESNWKTEEALARAAVTLETERIKGSNHWCLWWWWSHKGMIFGEKNVIGHNICVLCFSTSSVWNIFHSMKNWAGFDKKCTGWRKKRMFFNLPAISFSEFTSNQKSTFENLVQSTIWKFPFAKKLQLCHKKC